MSMFHVFDIAGSALTTHRTWMDAISDNIANINTVRRTSEPAYQERFIIGQERAAQSGGAVGIGGGVDVGSIELGDANGIVSYDPTHPLADANGLVRRPNIDLAAQMTNLIVAQRAYQLNLAVVERARDSYQQALQINGR